MISNHNFLFPIKALLNIFCISLSLRLYPMFTQNQGLFHSSINLLFNPEYALVNLALSNADKSPFHTIRHQTSIFLLTNLILLKELLDVLHLKCISKTMNLAT
jgi:hypothetical protein